MKGRELEALFIPARISSPLRLEKVDSSAAEHMALVCGNFESISFKDWHVYLNDEADYIPLPMNPRAEVLIREAGVSLERSVSGNAVFLGHDATGDETDVPVQLLELAASLFDTPLAA